jgi:hypothetical protein
MTWCPDYNCERWFRNGISIEGALFEVCTCNILCPCWVGEDPDGGTCDGLLGWRVDKGTVEGVDVSGITMNESQNS